MSKKGENIYKRKDKRWEARYIKGYSSNGAAQYGYCYGKTYSEAKEKVSIAKAALMSNSPLSGESSRKRFSVYCDEWLRFNKLRVKESTLVKYTTILEKHIKPRLGGYSISKVNNAVTVKFTEDLLYVERLSPKTIKDILVVLNSILKYSAKEYSGILPKAELFYPKSTKKEMRVLSKEEQTRFIEFLLKDTDECKFGTLFALLTGIRIGEICALKWENISLKDGTVSITSTVQRLKSLDGSSDNKTKIVISDPKSNTSARIIPLTDFVLGLCQKFKADNSAYILSGRADKIIEPRTLQYKMDSYTKACGFEGVHFHTLRHTFATRCVEVGFEIKSLSEILGHASPRITLERYVHSSLELKRKNMDKLEIYSFA